MNYILRTFKPTDTAEAASILKRNFLEINSKEESLDQIKKLTVEYTEEKIQAYLPFFG